jgi:predicted ATPase/DNA-binding CsgD family transcriptional regulator
LPVELTAFIGRGRELTDLVGLLGTARLVTVTGPGGVGKTRVALRAAARLEGTIEDGVCLVELSGLRDAELLPSAIAEALGLTGADSQSALDTVIGYLRDLQLLLILDTCEHLVDACAMFADVLLRTTTRTIVLATSRQPLDVLGEHAFPLEPLPVSDESGAAGHAVELFAQCAASAVPGFAVTAANRDAVIHLCRRLDGVPLAIELAAVRLRAIPVEHLISRLEDRFRLLTGGRRASLPHHQTLRAATEWSYDLCTSAEQLLWARLSVFAGPFDLAAAEQVCAGGELQRADVLGALVGLVDKSVVLRTGDEQTRYRLLDTIRDFGVQKLAGSGQATGLRERHIARYRELASHLGEHSQADDQVARLHQLRAEHADLRAALDYAFSLPGHDQDGADIALGLWFYWIVSGLMEEGDHWLGKVLDRFPSPSRQLARALIFRGAFATYRGDAAASVDTVAAGTDMAEESGDGWGDVAGRVFLCQALINAGRYPEATQVCATVEERARSADLAEGIVFAPYARAQLQVMGGQLAEGIASCDEALRLLGPDSRELWMHSQVFLLKALALYLCGDPAASAGCFTRALETKHEIGDSTGIALALEGTALLACAAERHARVSWLHGAADRLWQLVGGRLSGDEFLEALHQQAARAACDALGADRYQALFRRGAHLPAGQIVLLVTGDVDELERPSSPASEGKTGSLTRREFEIATLVAEGLSNREVAERLVISKRTVDAHIEHIYAKLGLSSRVQLTTWLATAIAPGRVRKT